MVRKCPKWVLRVVGAGLKNGGTNRTPRRLGADWLRGRVLRVGRPRRRRRRR